MIGAMWQRRSALLIVFLVLAVPAAAHPLRGGSTATLTMSLGCAPAGAEEWEAFLSIDGGAHYAIRITPHLNLAVQRVTWIVPNVDAAAARIMIRAGNERDETSFELPETFAITRDPNGPLPPMRTAPLTRAEEGVVAWAEGDRAGTRTALATNAPPPSGMASLRKSGAVDDALFDASKKTVVAPPATPGNRVTPQPRDLETPTPQHPNNILLLSTRMNV